MQKLHLSPPIARKPADPSGSGNNCTVHSPGNRQVRRHRVLLVQLRGSASAGKSPASSRLRPRGAPPHSPLDEYSELDPGPRPTAAGSSCKSTTDAPRAIGRLNRACPLAAVRPTRPYDPTLLLAIIQEWPHSEWSWWKNVLVVICWSGKRKR